MKRIIETIKVFFKTKGGIQVYSFVKTYVTVFIGIYLTLLAVMSEPTLATLQETNLIEVGVLSASAKGAFISIIRNVYKLLTEK